MRTFKNFLHGLVAFLANLFYFFPSRKMTVIGVTGTDGKTTTVHLMAHLLEKSGCAVGFLSTVSAPGLHVTTPDPWALQRILHQAVKAGKKYFIIEATSHGLSQNRLWGVRFAAAVLTNVSREHLDYHGSLQNYVAAKALLFRGVPLSVLNAEDASFAFFRKAASGRVVSYGFSLRAAFWARRIKEDRDGTQFEFAFEGGWFQARTRLPGRYNLLNVLAALATLLSLGLKAEKALPALLSFSGVPGRYERIEEGQVFSAIVDFAHTPAALEQVLVLSAKLKTSAFVPPALKLRRAPADRQKPKLIVVFGCAGERDKGKRPLMGALGAKKADRTVLTAEDPRNEDLNLILFQIKEGYLQAGGKDENLFVIPDRVEAIRFALLELALKNDLVLVTGKGHEQSMCFGKKEYPWDDRVVVRAILRKRPVPFRLPR